jgi:iron complex outermembrane receptor protein
LNHSFTKNNTLTTGFEFKKGSIKGGDYYQTAPYDTIFNAGEIITKAFYLQDEHAFFDEKMWLTAGFRFDNIKFTNGDFYTTDPWNESPELNENEWNELSPRIGMRFNFIKNISAYISYSHGFRASILDDLTRTGWMWVGPKYANPNLGPESLDNYEIGLDYSPSYKFRLATSAYLSKGNDFLYYVATDDSLFGRPIHIRENVTSVDITGFEAEAKYHFNTRLSFMANYNFSKTKILAFDQRPELLDKELKFTPNHIASASIFWKNRFFNSNLKLLYKSEQFADDINSEVLDAYYTLDFRVSKEFFDKFNASVEIIDLLDNQRMESNYYMSPGRIINLGLSLKM